MRLRRLIRDAISPHPRLFFPVFRMLASRQTNQMLVTDDTEIVIEGFPRSANTYLVTAFEAAQRVPRSVAHHTHAAAQVLEAVRPNIPCIVVVRKPEDAIRSLKYVFPDQSEKLALIRWISFYRAVERVRYGVVVADFDVVTRDVGSVIAAVNEKFCTSFDAFRPEDEERGTKYVLQRISEFDREFGGAVGAAGATPSQEKLKRLNETALSFEEKHLASAITLYRALVGGPAERELLAK